MIGIGFVFLGRDPPNRWIKMYRFYRARDSTTVTILRQQDRDVVVEVGTGRVWMGLCGVGVHEELWV